MSTFFMYSETNFQFDPTKDIDLPHIPHYKIRSLWQRHVYRHNVAKVSDFTMGVYGDILQFYRIQLNFRF